MVPVKRGPLDRLPALARHLALTFGAVLLSWIGAVVVPDLVGSESGLAQAAGAVLGALVPVAAAYWTTLTRQYGVGSSDGEA